MFTLVDARSGCGPVGAAVNGGQEVKWTATGNSGSGKSASEFCKQQKASREKAFPNRKVVLIDIDITHSVAYNNRPTSKPGGPIEDLFNSMVFTCRFVDRY